MNINSINTNYNNLYKTESLTQKSINRLSSAKKINSAADDAAGLAIVSGMTSQMNSLQVAQRNSSDGISATQTAGGSIKSMTDSLQRMRELAVQANNGTLSSSDRSALNQEFTLLNKSNDDIAKTSTFNNQNLLDGSYSSNIQTGANPGNTTNINISDVTNTGLGLNGVDITTAGNAQNALTSIDNAMNKLSTQQSNLGASQSGLEYSIYNSQVSYENTAAASRIQDTNYAEEVSNLSKANVLNKANMYSLIQQQQQQKNVLSLFV